MKTTIKVLLFENTLCDAALVRDELTRSGKFFSLEVANSRPKFIKALKVFDPDVILSGHSSVLSVTDPLHIMKDNGFHFPLVVIIDGVSEEFGIECIKAGADDYVMKNSLVRLPRTIEDVFARKEIHREKKIAESLHQKLHDAYREIEERNKNMLRNIQQAKRIQEAMLPNPETLSRLYPESFILYRPKDIVSGDFYWFTETADKFIIVVADCTGHGVSGALLSMIGHCLLNAIVGMKCITQPGKIIRILNMSIRRFLKQDTDNNQAWDGMDIGVCIVDRYTKTLEFAGANRSLYYLKNNKLEIIRGNRNGVGGGADQLVPEFTDHQVSFDPLGTIYLLTDGFADQFGGNGGKRITTRRMINWLQEIQSVTMDEQKAILNHQFDKWKGIHEQTDDMLLIGIRLKHSFPLKKTSLADHMGYDFSLQKTYAENESAYASTLYPE